MEVEYTLVINRVGKVLSSTRRTNMIRKKLRRKLAKHIAWLDRGVRVVQFLEPKYDDVIVTDTSKLEEILSKYSNSNSLAAQLLKSVKGDRHALSLGSLS